MNSRATSSQSAGSSPELDPGLAKPNLRTIRLILFLGLLFTYAWFPPASWSWNAVGRMGFTIGLVERGKADIDAFAEKTGDKAQVGEHFYCDKAPGLSIMAVPAAAAAIPLTRVVRGNEGWLREGKLSERYDLVTRICTVFTCGLLAALCALLIFELSLGLGSSVAGALVAALAYGVGSASLGWASEFFGHVPAGALLFAAFYLAHTEACARRDASRSAPHRSFLLGLCLGWAVVMEYTAAPAGIAIAVYYLWALRRETGRIPLRDVVVATAGGLLGTVPLLLHNALVFGGPFTLGYKHTVGFEGMQTGLFGVTAPQPNVLVAILVGPWRGLLWVSPILLATLPALWITWRGARWRAEVVLCVVVTICYLLINASYHYWNGGWSTGPRHVTPMLPFLCLPLALLWTRAGSGVRSALGALLAASTLISVACAAGHMRSRPEIGFPLVDRILPDFFAGRFETTGELVGISGLAGLVPLLLVWMLAGWLLHRHVRSIGSSAAPQSG